MNNLRLVSRLVPQAGSRCVSTTALRSSVSMKQSYSEAAGRGVVPAEAGYEKVRRVQTKFAGDDLLVWQKQGGTDRVGAYGTLLLCAMTTLLGVSIIWKMSFPPKKA